MDYRSQAVLDSTLAADLLFGRWLERSRHAAYVSLEVLADTSGMNEAWMRAVENGQVRTTQTSLNRLAEAAFECGLGDCNFVEVYEQLRDDPSGPLASSLYPKGEVPLGEPEDRTFSELGGGWLPLAGAVEPALRLLVLFPIVLSVLCLSSVYLMLAFEDVVPRPPRLSSGEMGLLAAGVLTFLVPFIRPFARLMTAVLHFGYSIRHRIGSGGHFKHLDSASRTAAVVGIPTDDEDARWYRPSLLEYCHPVARDLVAHHGFEIELFTRVRVVASFATLAYGLVWLLAVDKGVDWVTFWMALPTLATSALAAVTTFQIKRSAKSFRSAVQNGLGVTQRRRTPVQLPLPFVR